MGYQLIMAEDDCSWRSKYHEYYDIIWINILYTCLLIFNDILIIQCNFSKFVVRILKKFESFLKFIFLMKVIFINCNFIWFNFNNEMIYTLK